MKLAIWIKDGAIYRARRMLDTEAVDFDGMDCLIVPFTDDPSSCPQLYLRGRQTVYLSRIGAVLATGLPDGAYRWSADDSNVCGINTGDIEPTTKADPAAMALHRALSRTL